MELYFGLGVLTTEVVVWVVDSRVPVTGRERRISSTNKTVPKEKRWYGV